MEDEGFEFRGSSGFSPKDVKVSNNNYGASGWKRIEHFENESGQKVDIFHDEPEQKPKPSLADQLFDSATARLSSKQGGHAGGRSQDSFGMFRAMAWRYVLSRQ